jgi:hypothetical protein
MSPTESGPQVEAPAGMRRNVVVVLPGLMLAMLLGMLENFIVSTSLPRISRCLLRGREVQLRVRDTIERYRRGLIETMAEVCLQPARHRKDHYVG